MQPIILDLEWNQPTNFRSGGYRTSGGKLVFEMIQIGAVKLNENREIVDTFNQLIQPSCYTRLNPHIVKITHITPDELADAPYFLEAYNAFMDWCGDDSVLLTWGCDDISVFEQNVRYFGSERKLPPICDIQRLFAEEIGTPKERKSLRHAMEYLEIEPSEDRAFHNALNDAWYTAQVFAHMSTGNEKLGEYRLKAKPIVHQDKRHRTSLSVRKVTRGVPTMLKSRFCVHTPCPVCGRVYQLSQGYVTQPGRQYTALAQCPDHGLYYVRIRVVTHEDKQRYLERVAELTDEQSPAYVSTKLLQWQNKLNAQQKRAENGI